MEWRTSLILALFCVYGALTAPVDERCAKKCLTVYNPKYKYDTNKVYTYNYESNSKIIADGLATEQPGFKLTAIVELHVLTPCEYGLKLKNVKLDGDQPIPQAASFKQALESKNLYFSFTDGRIDHICPDGKDPIWVVNVKRAILSAFQNSADNNLESHVREADVLGLCDTHYTIISSGKSQKIEKTKNLLTCTHRQGNITSLQADHYYSSSTIQSYPVLRSTHTCTHTFANNILQSVVCEESHKSMAQSVATGNTASVKITYSKAGKSTFPPPRGAQRAPLLFDHSQAENIKSDKPETEKVLNEICAKSAGGDIPGDAAERFSSLVHLVRRLSEKDIRDLLNKAGACSSPKAKDTFVGSLVSAGTEASLKVVIDILNKGEISKLRSRLWLSSLAFIARPTLGIINVVTPLISDPNPSRTALLSVSALVHGYCRQNPDCEKDKPVLKVLDVVGRGIGTKCKAKDSAGEDKIIASLKAFGNIGRLGKYENDVLECVKDTSLHIPIRLAAIEAFRRSPASDRAATVFLTILDDNSEDTEVRISSYLGLIKRPNLEILHRIKFVLENVVNNQVSSFIWSHIHNILETKSPVKQHLKELVLKTGFEKRDYQNPTKFSQNYETSAFSDKYNLGSTGDANVIFTPESFLPRSASINLTVDLFGSAFNVLEVDTRVVNLERFLESYVGPSGKLRQHNVQELASKFHDRWHGIAEDIEKEATEHDHSKHKRELPYSPQKLNRHRTRAAQNADFDLEGSLSIKLFGNELRWYDFHKLEDIYDKEDPYNVKDILNTMAKHKELDVARNWALVDSTFYIPTISGFPLKYKLNATISVGLKLISHFDIRGLLLSPRNCDIKSFIQPSISLQWSGALLLDAYLAKTGLKVKSNFHSATAIDGTVKVDSGHLYVVKLDLPKKEQELFHIQSGLHTFHNDKESPATPVNPERYEIKECSQRLNLGVQLCGTISLPKPAFSIQHPVTNLRGPIEYQLTLKKVEENLQGYHFIAQWNREKDGDGKITNTEFKLSFDTPGSSVDREYSINYQLDRKANTLKANFRTPERKLELSGNYIEGDNAKEGKLVLKVDKDREYSVTGKATVKKQGNTETYNPTFEFSRPGVKTIIAGTVVRTVGKKIVFDLKSSPSSDRKVVIKGTAERDGPLDLSGDFKGNTDFQIILPYIDLKFKGNVEHEHDDDDDEDKHVLEAEIEYTLLPDGTKYTTSWKVADETHIDKKSHDYKFKRLVEWKSSRFPEYNSHVNLLLERNGNQFHNLLDAKWGENFDDPNNKFFYDATHKITSSKKTGLEGEGKIRIVYPRREIDWDISSKGQLQPHKQATYNMETKYAPNKSLKVSLSWKNESARLLKYKLDLKVIHPDRELALQEDFEETAPKQYKGTVYVQWQKDRFVRILYVLKDKTGGEVKLHSEAEVLVYLYGQNKPVRKYNFLAHVEQAKLALLFKVERPDVTYLGDLQYDRPAPGAANTKFDLKTPWIEGQVRSKRVPNDFDGNFDFKTEKRRVIGNAKLSGDTTKKLNAVLKWDAGHDDSQKLTINADINRPRERAATVKGTLEIPTRTIKGELKYALPLTLFNGVHIGYLDLEYAPNKKFTIDTKINIDKTNHDRRLSNGEIKLSGTDFHDLKVAYSTDYHKLPDQRSFKSQIHVEDSVHGNYIVSIANLFGPGKLSSDFEVTYDDDKKIGAGLGLFYDVGSRNGFDVGGSLKLHTPLREIAVTVREGFKRSPEYTHIIHDNHLQWAKDAEVGTTFEWTRKYEPGNGFEINGKLQILTPFENFRKHKLQAGVSFHRDVPHLGVDVDAIWGANKHLKSLIQYKRVGSQIDAHLLVDARSVNPLSFVEIVYNRVPSGEDKYSSTGSLAYRDKKYMYANSGFWTPEKKTVDATITVSNGEPKGHVKIKASLTTQGPKVNGDFTVTFSTGTKIIALADITRVGDSIKGKITVDPSALALDKVVIDIDHKMGGPKRQYGWKVNLGSDRQLDFGITVTDKKDGSGKKIDTLFKLNNDDFATSSVDLVHKTTDKTIFGHILSFSAVVKNDFLSVDTEGVLLSEKGLNPSLKICTLDKTKCAFTDILIDLHRWHKNPDAHDEHNDVHLKFGAQSAPGDSRTIGLIYGSRQKDNSFERTVKWAIHEEANKFIGYHFQSDQDSNGKTRVYHILLPSRTVEAKSETTFMPQGYVYKLHLRLDAIRKPNQELLLTVEVKNRAVSGKFFQDAIITIKHPSLANDITILRNLIVSEELTSARAEYRFSSDPKKAVVFLTEIKRGPSRYPKSHNHTYSFSIIQTAIKNFNFYLKGSLAHGDEVREVNYVFSWLNKDGTPKVYSFSNIFDKIQGIIHGALRTPYREFSWDGVYRKFDDGGYPAINSQVDLAYNGKLIRRGALDFSRGPEYNFRYFVDPTDTKRVFRLHGGLEDDNTYHWTATRVRDGKITEDFSLLLKRNTSHLLFFSVNWRPGLLKEIEEGLQARYDKIDEDVEKAWKQFITNVKEEVEDKSKNIREALKPRLGPFVKDIRSKLSDIVSELRTDIKATNLNRFKDVIDSIFGMFLETENLNLELDQRHQKFKDAIDRSLNAVGNFINLDVDQLVNLSEVSEFVAGQISILPQYVQRFSASLRARLPEILERIQAFVDNVKHAIDDIIQKQPITKTLEKISHHWEKLVERYGGDGTPGSIYERIRARLWEYAEGNGPLAKTLKEILTAIKTVKEKLQQIWERVVQELKEFRERLLRRISGLYDRLLENKQFQALVAEAKKYIEQLEAYQQVSEEFVRSRLGTAVREALARFREYVDHLNDSTVIDLRNGRISIYIPVLIPIESLREVRDSINIRDLFLQPWQTSSLLDAYYRIKPLVSSGVKQYVLPSDGKKP